MIRPWSRPPTISPMNRSIPPSTSGYRSPKYLSATGFRSKTSADAAVDAAKYVVDYDDGQIMAIHADAVGTGMKASYTTEDVSGETYEAARPRTPT